jgi:hypothetical protein
LLPPKSLTDACALSIAAAISPSRLDELKLDMRAPLLAVRQASQRL